MSLSEGSLDFLESSATKGFLTLGNPAFGAHSSAADQDGFRLYLQAGVTYGFLVVSQSQRVDFHLHSPSDLVVANSSEIDPSIELLEFTPNESGIFRMSVVGNGEPGIYGMLYDIVGGAVDDFRADLEESPLLPLGTTPVQGRLELGGDSDGFVVTLGAGQRYYIEYASSVSDLAVHLQDDGYANLPLSITAGGGSASFVAGQPGGALLLLDSASLTRTGGYSVLMAPTYSNTAHLVLGTAGNDDLTGLSVADEMHGGWGADTLRGGSGDDLLFGGVDDVADLLDGGAGVDRLDGGRGNDSYVVDHPADVIVEASFAGTDRVTSTLSWTLGANLEQLTLAGTAAINGTGNSLANTIAGNAAANRLAAGSGNDTLIGGGGNDTLDGGIGSDSMTGGGGSDAYTVDNIGDRVTETGTLAAEIDTVSSSVGYTLGANVERLTLTGTAAIAGSGNALANAITGNRAANTLAGGAGNDTLDGGVGNDTMVGGTGADRYVVDAVGDVVVESSPLATEIDTVQSSVSRVLGANQERLILTGSAAIDGIGNTLANVLSGNAAANLLRGGAANDTIAGGSGADTLDGGAGNDAMLGGAGSDVYFVDATGDVVNEAGTAVGERDEVRSSITYALGSRVENLVLTGSGVVNATGNALANQITGNGAANVINGGAGNDTLFGHGGNDTLSGGDGNDSLVGGTGRVVFRFASELDDDNVDRVGGFQSANDRITLDVTVFTAIGGVGVLAADAFRIGPAAADASDRIVYNPTTGALYYDADGTGSAHALLFATLAPGTALAAGDIWGE